MEKSRPDSEAKERRRYPRKKTLSLVSFVQKDGEIDKSAVITGRTLDISRGGACIESLEPIEPDTTMDMQFAFGDNVFFAKGTVVYCHEGSGEYYRVGIKFIQSETQFPELSKSIPPDIPG